MRDSTKRIAAIILVGAAACGARSALEVAGSGGAPSSASSSSASTGGSCPSPPATLGPCTSWATPTMPAPLLTNEGNKASKFGDDGSPIAADGDRVLIPESAYCGDQRGPTCPPGNQPPTWGVHSATADLSDTGKLTTPLVPASGYVDAGQLFVAARCPNRGAIAWESDLGCEFTQLAVDGSGGPPRPIGKDPCGPIRATSDGYVVLSRGTTPAVLDIDPTGVVRATRTLPLFPGKVDDLLLFDDGTLLVTGRSTDWSSILALHVDASGAALSPIEAIATEKDGYLARGEVAAGTRAIFVWAPPCGSCTTNMMSNHLSARWIDEMTLTGPKVDIGAIGQVESVDVTPTAHGALVAWLDTMGYFVQSLDTLGGPHGPAIPIPLNVPQAPDGAWYFPLTVRIAATTKGAVVVMESEEQVFATHLGCAP